MGWRCYGAETTLGGDAMGQRHNGVVILWGTNCWATLWGRDTME